MRKIVLIENIRRAWLSNVINVYPLIFVLPFYMLLPLGSTILFIYALIAITIQAILLARLSIYLRDTYSEELKKMLGKKLNVELAFLVVYGDCEPKVVRFFVPLMIMITIALNGILLSITALLIVIFVLFFIIIFAGTYLNIRNIRRNLDKLIRLLEE